MKKIVSSILVCVLLLGAVFALASCAKPNSDPTKAKAALEDNGYAVILNTTMLLDDDLTATIKAVDEDGRALYIEYYEDADEAKDAWEDIKKSDIEDYLNDNEDCVWKRSGTMIFKGHKDAVKAAK